MIIKDLSHVEIVAEQAKEVQGAESGGGITPRLSPLDPYVPVSVHTAPDVLGFLLAHVDIIVTAFMYS